MSMPRLVAAIIAAAIFVPATALACSVAGPRTHVGTLTGTDPDNGTFSIIDAESRQPMTFSAQPDIIESLMGTQGVVSIDYQKSGDDLTATDVRR